MTLRSDCRTREGGGFEQGFTAESPPLTYPVRRGCFRCSIGTTGFRGSDVCHAHFEPACRVEWSQATSPSEEVVEETEYCDETQSLEKIEEVDEEAEDAIEDSYGYVAGALCIELCDE